MIYRNYNTLILVSNIRSVGENITFGTTHIQSMFSSWDQSFLSNISIYKSLFHGREDIFAVRWEKNGKATYFPKYDYDPYQFRLHKMKGGTIQTLQNKTLSPLTDEQIEKHLNVEHFIGIYPLLKDNTSCFITADFDKAEWLEDQSGYR